jgi:heme exporter protein A
LKLKCENLSKSFNRNPVFKNITFELKKGDSIAITGGNGSGKSTLIKIIAGLINPDKGKIIIETGDRLPGNEYFLKIGLLAPYINLYDELTGKENLEFFYRLKSSFKKNIIHPGRADELLNKTGLYPKRNETVKNYSSGMKQRLKIAFALLSEPEILLMDEPGTNLDHAGKELVKSIAEEQSAGKENKNKNILIIATNDSSEKSLCRSSLNIEDFKEN